MHTEFTWKPILEFKTMQKSIIIKSCKFHRGYLILKKNKANEIHLRAD